MAFAEPARAVSLAPPSVTATVQTAPPNPPSDFQPQGDPVPLAALAPVETVRRDPRQPFTTVASVLTSVEAAGMVQKTLGPNPEATAATTDPREPFKVATSTPLIAASWAPPPDGAKPARAVYPAAVKDVLTAAYPPLLICLVLAGFVAQTSEILGFLIIAASTLTILPRVRFRTGLVRKTAIATMVVIAVVWLASSILSSSKYNIDLGLRWWVLVGSLGLATVTVIQQWLGLKYGETPNQTR